MSPEGKRTFEREWAVLSRRLRLLLVRKGVNPNLHDDLVQETALRLLSMWDAVDARRPLWPLTVTIALNLLRDRGRTGTKDDLVAEIPELSGVHDVEAAGLARVELDRVRRAMGELSGSQRSALMKEIGSHALSNAPDSSGDKMLRMRARRKLKMALENVSAVAAFRLRRLVEMMEAAFVAKDGAVSAASCVVCLVIGIGATVGRPAALTPRAEARPLESDASLLVPAIGAGPTQGSLHAVEGSPDEPRAGDVARATQRDDEGSAVVRKRRGAEPGDETSSGDGSDEGGLISVLPQDDDEVGPPPTEDVGVVVDGTEPAPLPDGGEDADPLTPPSQPPPPPPAPVNTNVPGVAVEVADTLL